MNAAKDELKVTIREYKFSPEENKKRDEDRKRNETQEKNYSGALATAC